jgi:hypothetical protein
MNAFMWGLLVGALIMEIIFIVLLFGDDISLAISKFLIDRRAERAKRLHDEITSEVRLRMAAIDRKTFKRISSAERERGKGS